LSNDASVGVGNSLLAALPRDEYERLLPNLESVRLPKNRILHEAGDTIHHAYFLNSGMTSLVAITEEGETIEIGTVGSEGFVGVPIVHEVGTTPYRVIVQMPAEAARIEPHHLIDEFNRGGKLRELLSHYAHVLEIQMVQSLVCHLFHNVGQRLSRYLLVTSDCLQLAAFDITQEHIANMMGKDRSQVGAAASALRQKGLIRYQRGRMTILDHGGLREASCECYAVVRDCMDKFLKQ
jgi:CRP-like cAMP-binding protein